MSRFSPLQRPVPDRRGGCRSHALRHSRHFPGASLTTSSWWVWHGWKKAAPDNALLDRLLNRGTNQQRRRIGRLQHSNGPRPARHRRRSSPNITSAPAASTATEHITAPSSPTRAPSTPQKIDVALVVANEASRRLPASPYSSTKPRAAVLAELTTRTATAAASTSSIGAARARERGRVAKKTQPRRSFERRGPRGQALDRCARIGTTKPSTSTSGIKQDTKSVWIGPSPLPFRPGLTVLRHDLVGYGKLQKVSGNTTPMSSD